MAILRKTRLAATLTTVLFLGACATVNPYTNQTQTSKARIGAGSGALVGAVAVGAVGYYMDVQEAKLWQKLHGTGVSLTRQGDNIVLNMTFNMTFNITFGVNSSAINGEFFGVLNSVDIVVKEYEKP